jgi:chromosome segregation ATPase
MAERSRLPQLSPARNGTADAASGHLRRELRRLYPRIQAIERGIASVRQTIPANAGRLLLQLTREVEGLRSRSPAFAGNPGTAEIGAQLADLESRVLQAIEVRMAESAAAVERRLRELEFAEEDPAIGAQKIDPSIENTEVYDRLRSIERSLQGRFQQNQARLSSLEKSLSKVLAAQAARDADVRLTGLSAEAAAQRQKLADLERRVAECKREAQRPPVAQPQRVEEEAVVAAPVPDLTGPVDALQKDMLNFRGSIEETLKSLNQKMVMFENRIQSLNQLAKVVSETVTALESRVGDAETVSEQISEEMASLAERLKDESDQKALRSLGSKLTMAYDDIRAQVAALQSKLKRCERDMPLLAVPPK